MNSDISHDFYELLELEQTSFNRQIVANIADVERKASAEGRLRSGATMQHVTREAMVGLQVYSAVLLNVLRRVSAAHGILIDKSNLGEFSDLLTRMLGREQQILMQMVYESAAFQTLGLPHAAKAAAEEVAHCRDVEQQRISTELRLLAKSNERPSEARGDTAIIFNGPIGSVQTGAGSIANVSQSFDEEARRQLSAALEKLLTDLNAHPSDDLPFNRNEVKELVIDAQSEANKPTPNMTKLRSVVKGIGTAIEYVPKTKEAYDALKWAGALFGLSLP